MPRVRAPRPAEQDSDDETADSVDVPAAVICAWCGRGDCAGCAKERAGASGVIAIVPWERPLAAWPGRFFATVQATTQGAEGFFRSLPDGPISPAFVFALIAEVFAVASTAAVVAPLVVLGIPGLLLRFLSDDITRSAVLLSTLVGVARVYLSARRRPRAPRLGARARRFAHAGFTSRILRVRLGFRIEPGRRRRCDLGQGRARGLLAPRLVGDGAIALHRRCAFRIVPPRARQGTARQAAGHAPRHVDERARRRAGDGARRDDGASLAKRRESQLEELASSRSSPFGGFAPAPPEQVRNRAPPPPCLRHGACVGRTQI